MFQKNIRNFVITAHIDHGKSTLADRMLQLTGTVDPRKFHAQYLDTMGLEQERGITIKMQPVTMRYTPRGNFQVPNPQIPKSDSDRSALEISRLEIGNSNSEFILNLIDTPGHVDFGYEVSRALAAVEGAILLVDATQGVQAQTIANLEQAILQDLVIIPVLNKIDLPQARPDAVKAEIAALLDIDTPDILSISAKEGMGIPELLERVVARIPSPKGTVDDPARALIFDSHYDDFRGVVAHVRVVDGAFPNRAKIRFLASGVQTETLEVGRFVPELVPVQTLETGMIGYIATGLKDPDAVRIGDTVVLAGSRGVSALPGYAEPKPVVYAALFPEDADEYDALRDSLEKLKLNDAALVTVPEESHALGRGFRLGFLGTLHLEIVVERLRREHGLSLVVTHPSVAIQARVPSGETISVRTPRDFPEQAEAMSEPWVRVELLVPPEHLSSVVQVISETRGTVEQTETVTESRLKVIATIPLLDVVEDFSDKLKSATSGYASFSWSLIDFRPGDLVKLRVMVAHDEVEALNKIVPRIRAEREARRIARRLKEALPAQLFAVAIQVAIGTRVIARETITAMRKNVTEGLYGGDFTRKKKLLVKQRKGKKRMEKAGKVQIPAEVFVKLLKR